MLEGVFVGSDGGVVGFASRVEAGLLLPAHPVGLNTSALVAKRDHRLVLDSFRAMLALIACVFAFGGPDQGTELQLATVGLVAYSALVLGAGIRSARASRYPGLLWIDAAWAMLLFSLSGG